MKNETAELIEVCLTQLGLDGRKEVAERLLRYAGLVLSWNLKVNLVGTQDEAEFVVKHLADSLSAWKHFTPGASIADIGSGGGLPGIPLAIALGCPVTLVESKAKKAEFLSSAVKELSLPQVKVELRNANELRGTFDFITTRAFSDLGHTLKLTARLGKPGTQWLFYKGRRDAAQEECAGLTGWACELIPLSVPLLEAERHLVKVTRTL